MILRPSRWGPTVVPTTSTWSLGMSLGSTPTCLATPSARPGIAFAVPTALPPPLPGRCGPPGTGGTDIAHQAALLAHGIAEGQHFLEGNERTALVCLIAFLGLNGYRLTAPQAERFRWMVDLSGAGHPDTLVGELARRIRADLVRDTVP